MKYLIALSVIGSMVACRGENQSCIETHNNALQIVVYAQADKMPVYKNGMRDFLTDLGENLVPFDTVHTILNLEFIVLPNGKVSDLKVYDGDKISSIIQDVIEKAIMKIDAWTPGECNGEKVAVKMEFPVTLDWQE